MPFSYVEGIFSQTAKVAHDYEVFFFTSYLAIRRAGFGVDLQLLDWLLVHFIQNGPVEVTKLADQNFEHRFYHDLKW